MSFLLQAQGPLPAFDRTRGWGVVTEAVRLADPLLQVPETGNGFVPLWWYAGQELSDTVGFADRVQAVPAEGVRGEDLVGRTVPLWFRCEVPREGAYRVGATLCGVDEAQEVLVFVGRRRLLWRGHLAAGERRAVAGVCDAFPIVPRGQTDPAPCTGVDLTVVGAALCAVTVCEASEVHRVWVMGDSTVTDQSAEVPYAPGTSYAGWGQMLPTCLPTDFCVTNHAHSGLTTETFETEGHWAIVQPRLRQGDIVLMQFGHNDQKLAHLQARGGYTDRLRAYIAAVQKAWALPVLVTPLARNSWAGPDTYNDLLKDFADAVIELGAELSVPVIDLHGFAMQGIVDEGLEGSKRWFFPGDYTHTNDFGALRFARFVAEELCRLMPCAAPEVAPWEPYGPHVCAEPPEDCDLTPPEGTAPAFAGYDTDRPDDVLTRVEALGLSIAALRYFPINVYNDLYADVVGHETWAGTVQCAAQNGLIPAAWVENGCLHPDAPVTCAEFLAVLMPGYAGRHAPEGCAEVTADVPEYARQACGEAVFAGLVAPEALCEPLARHDAAEICRKLVF